MYVVTASFAPTIFTWFNAKGAVLEACVAYFSIRAIGFPFTLATLLLFGLFHYLSPGLFGIWVAFLVWMCVRAGWVRRDFHRRFKVAI